MFHLAVVLESGDVVGGGLDTQDEVEFVVDFDRGLTETMLDAGALDPRRELAADLLGELGSDLVAEEGGDVFGFDGQDGLPGKLFIEGFEDGWRAEHQISGVFLHETPVVGLGEDVEHRTALLGIVIEDAMQVVGREGVGEGLRALPVVDAQKGVVGKGETDAGGGELAGQPAMPIAIELQTERAPGRHAQIDQAQLGVDEVEVVMQAFASIRPQEGAMRVLVMPGLVGVAGTSIAEMICTRPGRSPRTTSTLATASSLRMWFLAMCSMVMPAALANSAARSRTRSRSGSANRG